MTHENENKSPNFVRKIWNRLGGTVWGFFDGSTTGTLVGIHTAEKSFWFPHIIKQTIYGFNGMIIGCVTGTVLGALTDKPTVSDTMKNYRQTGIIKKN